MKGCNTLTLCRQEVIVAMQQYVDTLFGQGSPAYQGPRVADVDDADREGEWNLVIALEELKPESCTEK